MTDWNFLRKKKKKKKTQLFKKKKKFQGPYSNYYPQVVWEALD